MSEPLIVWKKEYSIGVEEIDEQHKKLLDIANKFISAKVEGREFEVLKETFVNLVEYTKIHFATEEQHMINNNYYGYEEHKRQHQVLIGQVKRILENFHKEQSRATEDLLTLLKNWLVKHMIDHDKQYGKFLED